jgi:hypothetical protein
MGAQETLRGEGQTGGHVAGTTEDTTATARAAAAARANAVLATDRHVAIVQWHPPSHADALRITAQPNHESSISRPHGWRSDAPLFYAFVWTPGAPHTPNGPAPHGPAPVTWTTIESLSQCYRVHQLYIHPIWSETVL